MPEAGSGRAADLRRKGIARGLPHVAGEVAGHAPDPVFFVEHDIANHRPEALLLFEAQEPDHAEDVTGYAGPKIEALLAHESQFETTHEIADASDSAARQQFAEWVDYTLSLEGDKAGVRHAELFKAIVDL